LPLAGKTGLSEFLHEQDNPRNLTSSAEPRIDDQNMIILASKSLSLKCEIILHPTVPFTIAPLQFPFPFPFPFVFAFAFVSADFLKYPNLFIHITQLLPPKSSPTISQIPIGENCEELLSFQFHSISFNL
jgi:hypothetical protein